MARYDYHMVLSVDVEEDNAEAFENILVEQIEGLYDSQDGELTITGRYHLPEMSA